MIPVIVFWASLGLIVYAYAGFPLLLLIRACLRRVPASPAVSPPPLKDISLIIVAHNEAETIRAKLDNVQALDYPPDRVEVIVASDGSDDGTDEIVASVARPNVRLLSLPRTGKIPALNTAVSRATGEILVFSDANSMYARDALHALISPFADPAVGAVGGNQCYVREGDHHMATVGERLYWAYDRMLKQSQSRAGHMTAATGAIHAIRRHLFAPVPTGVSDDFMTSTRAILQGYRLVFAPDAIAWETVAPSEGAEFARKQRIIARGLRGLWVFRAFFDPRRFGFYSLQLFSHKLLRWSVCWLLIVLLAATILLQGGGAVYRLAAYGQLGFYGCAMVGLALHCTPARGSWAVRLFGIPFYFCLANYAALRAWLQVLAGERVDAWDSARNVRLNTSRV